MPIYIVRWVNYSASIIRADDEHHLRQLLDGAGDPDGATWKEYDSPLWIELGWSITLAQLPQDIDAKRGSAQHGPC